MQIVLICSVGNSKSSRKEKLTAMPLESLWNYVKIHKQITKTQHMTSDAQINPYFHVEDKVEDALEARLTI